MSDVLLNWGILCGVFMVALISPGPDFVVAVRSAITHNRRASIFTALGFAGGVAVHVTYCLFGIAAIVAQSIILFNILKYAGAAYLFYIGIQSLRSNGFAMSENNAGLTGTPITDTKAFRIGFMTNLLNPKATLFFMALFTQFIHADTSALVGILYGLTCVTMTFLWFSVVATILTTPAIRARFLGASQWIDRVCGVALLALGVRLAMAKAAS